MHTCTSCGKEYEGGGWQRTSDVVSGHVSLHQRTIFTECKDCAKKDMDKANEARIHKEY
jgi:hypothetical protein